MSRFRRFTALLAALVIFVFAFPVPQHVAAADETLVTIPDLMVSMDDLTLNSEEHSEDGSSRYMYSYAFGSACYDMTQLVVDQMVASGFFRFVNVDTYGDSMFWQLQYAGGGELTPLGTCGEDSEEYHVELGCAFYDWTATFVSITMGPGIAYGDGYSGPTPDALNTEGASVTVENAADYLGGCTLIDSDMDEAGVRFLQYEYGYGDTVYELMDMYVDSIVSTGLFVKAGFQRIETACFWQLKYVGPGAESFAPIAEGSEGPYHVEMGCAAYYLASRYTNVYYVSMKLGAGIAPGEKTWAEGYVPGNVVQQDPGRSYSLEETQRPCPSCGGTGDCQLCGGTGTYRAYGEEVSCDPNCAYCDGAGWITVLIGR